MVKPVFDVISKSFGTLGAPEGNRTPVSTLGRLHSTIELLVQMLSYHTRKRRDTQCQISLCAVRFTTHFSFLTRW